MRGKWVLFSVTVILLGAAAGAVSLLIRGPSSAAPEVIEAPVAGAPRMEEISLSGTVVAQSVVGVPAPVEGTLESVMVAIGEEVYAGQLLAQIRNTAVEAELRVAEEETIEAEDKANRLESQLIAARLEASRASADLARARSTFQRAEAAWLRSQTLIREGATPRLVHERVERDYLEQKREFESLQGVADAASNRVESLRRQVETAEQRLDEAREEYDLITSELLAADVVATANGLIAGMSAQQGDEVHPEAGELFQIALDLSRLDVVLETEASVSDRAQVGQPARIMIAEIPGGSVSGTVREVREGRIVVEFMSPTPAVMPGMSAQVTITFIGAGGSAN